MLFVCKILTKLHKVSKVFSRSFESFFKKFRKLFQEVFQPFSFCKLFQVTFESFQRNFQGIFKQSCQRTSGHQYNLSLIPINQDENLNNKIFCFSLPNHSTLYSPKYLLQVNQSKSIKFRYQIDTRFFFRNQKTPLNFEGKSKVG